MEKKNVLLAYYELKEKLKNDSFIFLMVLFIVSLALNVGLFSYNLTHEYSYFSYVPQEKDCMEWKQYNLSDHDDENESGPKYKSGKEDEKKREASQLLNWVSSVMAIIAAGIAMFALFGGFLSLINMNMSKDLREAILKANQYIKAQKESTASRYLQEGRNYYAQRKKSYAEDAYMQAIHQGENTFSASLAKYEIGLLYADSLDFGIAAQYEALKWFKKAEDDLEENHLGNIEYFNLIGDIWFSRGCYYGIFADGIKEKKYKERYLNESAKCFRKAIRVGIHKVDYYRNLSATCESLKQYDECKEYLEKAYREAENDILDKSLLTTDRLYPLFGIEIDDKTKKVIPAEKQKMKDIIDELYAKYNSSNN